MKEHLVEHKAFYLFVGLPMLILFPLMVSKDHQRRMEQMSPPEERPYTLNCFTPEGWKEYKSFREHTMGREGGYLFLIKRENGTTFRSSMCQIEAAKGVKQ